MCLFWFSYSRSFFLRYFFIASTMICISSRSWRIRMKEVFSFVSKTFNFLLICFVSLEICDMVLLGFLEI